MFQTTYPNRSILFGEDVHELLVSIEDSFGIKLTCDEILGAETVGQLFDLIAAKLQGDESNACTSSAAFYRLRMALTNAVGSPRDRLRPDTKLSDLMPRDSRRADWDNLRRDLDWELPDLVFPQWLHSASISSLYCMSGAVLCFKWGAIHPYLKSLAILASVVAPLVAHAFLLRLARPFALIFPERCESIRDIVNLSSSRNFAKISSASGWNKREAWLALRRLIADAAALSPGLVLRDTRFPEDLNIE